MKINLFLILILPFFISCQKKETKASVKKITDTYNSSYLYNKVFLISSNLDSENCKAFSYGCDCCEGKIIFLKNNTFISDFYCIPDNSYNTGTFQIKKQKLILNYSKKEVVLGPENGEIDNDSNVLKIEAIEGGITSLDIISCNKKYIFKSSNNDFYSEDKQTTFTEAINEYKEAGVWKLLGIKD